MLTKEWPLVGLGAMVDSLGSIQHTVDWIHPRKPRLRPVARAPGASVFWTWRAQTHHQLRRLGSTMAWKYLHIYIFTAVSDYIKHDLKVYWCYNKRR